MEDLLVEKLYFYNGPNYYLDCGACVFNLNLNPSGHGVSFYEPHVLEVFPTLVAKIPDRVADLFAEVLMRVLRMDIDLHINRYDVRAEGDDYEIAIAYFDKKITKDAIYLVSTWFRSLDEGVEFDFAEEFRKLREEFDRTVYGGPTIYSLIEAGLKRGIPVQYLYEENQFQWGYGRKQVRGRSTTFHVDGIKDTEFTTFKDMVKDFLLMCGFPTPVGKNCLIEAEVIAEAEFLGFPLVIKPVAGHKGQGVTTGIASLEEIRTAFQKVLTGSEESGERFQGAIVEQQVEGTDHRLLTIGGKFAAGLQRIPAYVDGNGTDTVETLIQVENSTIARLDNARSPLCKIGIDDDLTEYLRLQNLTLDHVPKKGERIYLRRVANISAGGVSINVTDRVHPKNKKLAEDIAKYFQVTCLGIDVLAEDISVPWDQGNFGIIEINAGPGVFMHLAPAVGESLDVPGMVMSHFFPRPECSRIPIIAGNRITPGLCNLLFSQVRKIKPDAEFGSLTSEGVCFNGEFFCKNKRHDLNLQLLFRNPRLDFAVVNHDKDAIFDYGTWHEGADIVILEEPHYAEKILVRDLLPGGHQIIVRDGKATLVRDESMLKTAAFSADVSPETDASAANVVAPNDRDRAVAELVAHVMEALVKKYD